MPTKHPRKDKKYTVTEVAGFAGKPQSTIRRWINTGSLPAKKENFDDSFRKRWMIKGGDVINLLKEIGVL